MAIVVLSKPNHVVLDSKTYEMAGSNKSNPPKELGDFTETKSDPHERKKNNPE
jgi:hypothetical protein